MQMITSAAGTRLAKARASEVAAFNHWSKFPTQFNWEVWKRTQRATDDAGRALADELIASGYHQLDGEG